MNRHIAVMIAALIVNFLAALALNFVTSPVLLWLLFSVASTATAVAIYGGWQLIQESRVLGASTVAPRLGAWMSYARDRALRLTKPTASTAAERFRAWIFYARDRALRLTKRKTRGASTSQTGFRCSISDTTGLLVTYVGPDSCELSRLLAAIREFRRVDPAESRPAPQNGA